MQFDAVANFPYTLVATAPSPATSGTSLVVTAGTGVLFPVPPFNAVIWPTSAQPLAANAEIVRVTGIASDTLTIVRGPQAADPGGINRTVSLGDQIAANVTLKTLTDMTTAINLQARALFLG